jgi:transketolase
LLLGHLLEAPGRSGYLRLISVPWPVPFSYPVKNLTPGQGVVLREGKDAAIVTYGLIMTAEAYEAAELLAREGIAAAVIACPFLNRIDGAWFAEQLKGLRLLCTLDNHYANGGFGDHLLSALACNGFQPPRHVLKLGIEDVPASGQPAEVLRHHRLDSDSLCRRIRDRLTG